MSRIVASGETESLPPPLTPPTKGGEPWEPAIYEILYRLRICGRQARAVVIRSRRHKEFGRTRGKALLEPQGMRRRKTRILLAVDDERGHAERLH
jgi:hypothetical protein